MLHQYAALNPSDVRGLEIGRAQFRFITEIAALLNRSKSMNAT